MRGYAFVMIFDINVTASGSNFGLTEISSSSWMANFKRFSSVCLERCKFASTIFSMSAEDANQRQFCNQLEHLTLNIWLTLHLGIHSKES